MSDMRCPRDGCRETEPISGSIYCPVHYVDMLPADEPGEGTPERTEEPDAVPPALELCWYCRHPVDTNAICVHCQRPRTPPPLLLRFTTGEIVLDIGEQAILGRDPDVSPHARILAAANISRRHATVGVDDGGQVWIRDEKSTNGTFVNEREIGSTPPTVLDAGDEVRLGRNNRCRVETPGWAE